MEMTSVITLLFSISCSVAVSVLLKLAPRWRLDISQIVAINYAMASLLCIALLQPHPSQLLQPSASWFILLALGLLLPSIFIVMAAAVRQAGIVRSDAAQRLSLLIPLLAAYVAFDQPLSACKGSGIVVALSALVLLLIRRPLSSVQTDAASSLDRHPPARSTYSAILLLGVRLGYGLIDI